jgi:hypothetical protein
MSERALLIALNDVEVSEAEIVEFTKEMKMDREDSYEFKIIAARNILKKEARKHVEKELENGEEILHTLATSNEEVKAAQGASTFGTGIGLTMDYGVHTIVTVTNNRIFLSYFDAICRYMETISYSYDEIKGVAAHTESYSKLDYLYIGCKNGKRYLLVAGQAHYDQLFEVLRTIPAAEGLVTLEAMEKVKKKLTWKNRKWNYLAFGLFLAFGTMIMLSVLRDM